MERATRRSKYLTPSKATPTQVERAIAALRFGCVTLNGWSVLGYLAACRGASWGAHPDGGPRSGCGVSGNAYGHTHVIKTVVRRHTPRHISHHRHRPHRHRSHRHRPHHHRPSPPPPPHRHCPSPPPSLPPAPSALPRCAARHSPPRRSLAAAQHAQTAPGEPCLGRGPEPSLALAGPERGSCVSLLLRLGARLAAPRRCRGRAIGCPATASAARASLPQSRRSHSFRPSRPRAPTGGLRRAARGSLRAVHGACAAPAVLAAGGARRAEPQRGSGRAGRTARGIRRSGLRCSPAQPQCPPPPPPPFVREERAPRVRPREQALPAPVGSPTRLVLPTAVLKILRHSK